MIYKLFGAETVMLCKRCRFQSKLSALSNPQNDVNFCPDCVKQWKRSVLVKLEESPEHKFKEKLSRHIYCPSCKFTGLSDAFPQRNFQDAISSDQYCPVCFNGQDLISASEVKFCKECRTRQVYDDFVLCVGCSEKYEAAYENERDREPF